ncbi:MAG: hypothetical protein QOF29_2454 [bacterium]
MPRAVEPSPAPRFAAAATALVAVTGAVAGCGGDAPRQDAGEPPGRYRVAIVATSFPARQRLARQERLVIAVQNRGRATVPELSVTVHAFSTRARARGLADAERPVWVIDRPPRGSTTANASTWSLGRLPAGHTKRFVWRVTPVRTGTHRLSYRVTAGLAGRAKAVAAGGGAPARELVVRVSGRPSASRVDPESGAVVRDGG